MSSTMISSAVVIPEQLTPNEEPSSPSLKRRASSQSLENNKRPRLDSIDTNGNGIHASPPPSAMSPPHRKSSLLTGTEEKKRGQRLFGALLGTLSQTSSKPAHKKRDEIEKRQQERLRRDTEEREEERRLKKEELERSRREELKVWERESDKLRQRNRRAIAGFLRTKTEPRLYYKPWELRAEEEEVIRKQVDEVEDELRPEQAVVDGRAPTPVNEDEPKEETKEELDVKTEDVTNQNGEDTQEDTIQNDPATESGSTDDTNKDAEEPPQTIPPSKSEEISTPPTEEKAKEDDHGGEELVEGHEDDVIY